MTENSPATAITHNQPEFTVGEISLALKRTLEHAFGHVRVRGEISGFRRHTSGHLYFSLKDADAVLDAVCWRGTAAHLSIRPEDGIEVVCSGRITTYPGRSRYQIVVESIDFAGEGALLKLLEERRRRLAAEGLFAAEAKKALPYLPEVIGVVTSPTGAVIRDILHRLADRFPRRVILWPVAVQGEGAAEQVAGAIRGFNAIAPGGAVARPDLLIVARGGGSLEDLWPFNEEVVVRAAATSEIPLVSAIGHETDTTLIDFAADRRAPTPTAAAEMAVPVRAELLSRVLDVSRRAAAATSRLVGERQVRVEGLSRGLPDPHSLLDVLLQKLDDESDRLGKAMAAMVEMRAGRAEQLAARLRHPREQLAACRHGAADALHRLRAAYKDFLTKEQAFFVAAGASLRPQPLRDRLARERELSSGIGERLGSATMRRLDDAEQALKGAAALLEGFSYQRVLERGFVLVRDTRHRPVTSVAATRPGLEVELRFHDGEAGAVVTSGTAEPKPRRRTETQEDAKPRQGTLL